MSTSKWRSLLILILADALVVGLFTLLDNQSDLTVGPILVPCILIALLVSPRHDILLGLKLLPPQAIKLTVALAFGSGLLNAITGRLGMGCLFCLVMTHVILTFYLVMSRKVSRLKLQAIENDHNAGH